MACCRQRTIQFEAASLIKHLTIVVAILTCAYGPQSQACPFSSEGRRILRDNIPLFPGDASVLGVQAIRYRREPPHGVDAMVTRVANGPPGLNTVTILSTSSCDQLPRPGERGVVIGKLSLMSDGTYRLWPTPEQSFSENIRAERRFVRRAGIFLGVMVVGWFLWWRWKRRASASVGF